MMVFPEPDFSERVLARHQVAERLGVCERTLRNWAERDFGPRPVSIGGVNVYDRDQVDTFLAVRGGQ